MTNAEAWKPYSEFTKAASENSRKLALSGVALAWSLKAGNSVFPPGATIALIFLVLFFLCDLLQYYLGAFLNRRWVRSREIELFKGTGSIEGDYQRPTSVDVPATALFHLKIVSLAVAFVSLGITIFSTVKF